MAATLRRTPVLCQGPALSRARYKARASRGRPEGETKDFFRCLLSQPPTSNEGNDFCMPSSSLLSRLKNGEAIGVVDEDAPEESRIQNTVEPLYVGILVGGRAYEGHAGQCK